MMSAKLIKGLAPQCVAFLAFGFSIANGMAYAMDVSDPKPGTAAADHQAEIECKTVPPSAHSRFTPRNQETDAYTTALQSSEDLKRHKEKSIAIFEALVTRLDDMGAQVENLEAEVFELKRQLRACN